MVKIVGANVDLHVHVFVPERNSIDSVLDSMRRNKLDIISPSLLDASIYPCIFGRAYSPNQSIDSVGIIFRPIEEIEGDNTKILFNAREYNTKEGLHILTIGYSSPAYDTRADVPIRDRIDEGLEHNALVVLDHPYADNIRTSTVGHINLELEEELEKICREYNGEIAIEWNGYCNKHIRAVAKPFLNLYSLFKPSIGRTIYHDVNKKAEQLSEKLAEEGYNIPVVADTDLHGRNKRLLNGMGIARFIVDVEGSTPKEFLQSMKDNIFSGNYENDKRPAGLIHMTEAFIIPVIGSKISNAEYFSKPRS